MNLINTSPAVTSLALNHEADSVAEVVRQWHDNHHQDGWGVCTRKPCADIHQDGSDYEAVRDWHDATCPDPWSSCMAQPCHAVKQQQHGAYALNLGLPR